MDGLLIVDKPTGWTSHDAVARARRILRERKIGHTGTLDPFATGVLVLLVGRATRLAQFLAGAEKEYEATVRLGYATETGDLTGARRGAISERGEWGAEEIEAALRPLRGEITQVPPMYSAKKVQGKRLYELARRGEERERAPVRVKVYALEAVENKGAPLRRNGDGTYDLRIRVVCSAGTYVRALAEAIGEGLGVGAHLAVLRRTRAGRFRVEEAVSFERLAAGSLHETVLPADAALLGVPAAHLTSEDARRVLNGAAVAAPPDAHERWLDGARVRLYAEGAGLIAVGIYDAIGQRLRPRVTLAGGEK